MCALIGVLSGISLGILRFANHCQRRKLLKEVKAMAWQEELLIPFEQLEAKRVRLQKLLEVQLADCETTRMELTHINEQLAEIDSELNPPYKGVSRLTADSPEATADRGLSSVKAQNGG